MGIEVCHTVALSLGLFAPFAKEKSSASRNGAVFNFCKVHSTLGTTPAHGAEITEGPWTIERLIEEATKCC